ncbi:GAF and ANTAR domain-containing protein [Streptomyces sp. BBFR51]|uniref:GAF and ANTAR domain-containing protein n=1 Tax=Streptomyces sp. BBFR51 TaxID=3372856 RepID=UPI0037DCFF8F
MISDRMAKVLPLLRTGPWPDVAAHAADLLGVDRIAVSVGSGSGEPEILWSSEGASRGFEDLQTVLGHGPGPDCLSGGIPVRVPDLARVRADRWPALVTEASALAVQAVFCFPLRIGAITLGVLTLVRSTAGHMSPAQGGDVTVLAGVVTERVLELVDPQLPSPEHQDLAALALPQAVVHQATGMVSVQLAVPLAEALLRLRAYAYSNTRTLNDTAQDIVSRRLRLAPDPQPPNDTDDADED